MTHVAFGVIHAALKALDADLSPERIASLDAERLAGAWRASGDVAEAAEAIHDKLRAALGNAIADATRSGDTT